MTGARFARVPSAAAACRDLGARDLRVLIAIASFAGADGRAWPSLSTIARLTGIGRADLPRIIGHLEDAKLIRRDRGGGRRENVYHVASVSAGADAASAHTLSVGTLSVGTLSAQEPASVSAGADAASANPPSHIENKSFNRSSNRLSVRKRTGGDERETANLFDRFWRAYPSRGGHANPKKPAREKFEVAVKRGIDPELLIRAASNYAEAMGQNGTAGRFIKTAEVWLNKASWEQYAQAVPDLPLAAGMI